VPDPFLPVVGRYFPGVKDSSSILNIAMRWQPGKGAILLEEQKKVTKN
jgi:hypothetical protein